MSSAHQQPVRKNFRLDPAQIARAKKALGTSTETETIVRALDMVITEDSRSRLAQEANQRFLKSGIRIRDVLGNSEE